jgi:hypothetical protein
MSERCYLILSLNHSPGWDAAALWWGPDQRGYYSALEAAGRYTEAGAREICKIARGNAVAVLEEDAMAMAYSVVEWSRKVQQLAKFGGAG